MQGRKDRIKKKRKYTKGSKSLAEIELVIYCASWQDSSGGLYQVSIVVVHVRQFFFFPFLFRLELSKGWKF